MRWMWLRAAFVGTLGLVAGGALGCAEERAPINRVQANALAKSFFVGDNIADDTDNPEFWTQGTVVDVGYGAAQDGLFTSTYAQPVGRLKWQITEDLLIGRLTYERVEDTDGKKGVGPSTNQGVIVVAYPIVGHFDIRYDYNPSTGEQMNVLVENASDRTWDKREYFRVDWSRNLNVSSYDFDTLSLLGLYGGVEYESLAYYVNDPEDPDAPHFDPDTGYFDITNKAFARPKMIDLSHLGWGIDKFPACYLDNDFFGGSAPSGNCNPVELTIRQSFRRVVDRDYEPVNWDGKRFTAYGAFYVERSGYARNYGMSDDKWYRFINRYNIWERSHYYQDPEKMTGAVECYVPGKTLSGDDPHRDLDGNGTEDECEEVTQKTGVAGSRCDEFKQKCTLPYRSRKEVPQAWYYSQNSDPEYFDGSEWATHEWDVAMRAAVMSARNAECKATGGDPGGCDAQYPMYRGQMDDNWDFIQLSKEVDACRAGLAYKGQNCDSLADQIGAERKYDGGVIALAKLPEMIVLCHSPVTEADSPACGPIGRTVRQGDLRYHQINVIGTPQTPSPWGIMTDSDDPLTGEKIAGSANVWSHVTDLWSQGIVDQMRYLNGELSTEEVTDGTYVKDWAIASQVAGGTGMVPPMTREQIDRRSLSSLGVMPDKMKDVGGPNSVVAKPEFAEVLQQMKHAVLDIRADAEAPSTMRPKYELRRKNAAGTEVEAELTTVPMQQLSGTDKLPMNDGTLNLASPLRGNHPNMHADLRHMKELALADRGMCELEMSFPSPVSLTALDRVVKEKFKDTINPRTGKPYGVFADPAANTKQDQLDRAEAVRKFLAQRAHYSVMAHEMGHSIGLRHNFVSSSDAWGFRPQYWQLRTKNGKVTTACTDLKTEAQSEACVGPRYWDVTTKNEREQLINMFMHQSAMEYAGEATQDFVALSAYDFAATRMFYGQTVAVHADTADFNSNRPLGKAVLDKMDGFGGIIGYQYTSNGSANIHYSQLQKNWKLIDPASCVTLSEEEVQKRKPATWNDARDGKWSPLLDGLIVQVDGEYSVCKQRKVDYVPWQSMKDNGTDFNTRYSSVDPQARTRVPYGFATDRWADLGNLAVYRHDNGADPYELFNFFIAQQEVNHIFDNFRRNRRSFSIRAAAGRTYERYNTKMRDAAKGLGLLVNIYRDFSLEAGFDFDSEWPGIAKQFYQENIIASGLAFDHFARQVARPQAGAHQRVNGDLVLRSTDDIYSQAGPTALNVPMGVSGYVSDTNGASPGAIGIGGRWLENRLADDKGNDYDSEYTLNAGSYYDKAYAAILLTESVDNFISASRQDFLDARYRSIAMADLFPEGYRRWLANNLTGDDYLKGAWVKATATGSPDVDSQKFPRTPIGWTSWWPAEGPQVCFPGEGTTVCSAIGWDSVPFEAQAVDVDSLIPIDPQVSWEQQKFLIAWTMNYLPENQQQWWINMLRMWEIGQDDNPSFDNRIEFHDPTGKSYVAKTFGTEVLFPGTKYEKLAQRGISARVLQYANDLLVQAYVTDPVDYNNDTKIDWYVARTNPQTGKPLVKYDPSISTNVSTCNASDNSGCTCTSNRACVKLSRYVEVPFFIRQAMNAYWLGDPSLKGIWD